MIHKLITDFFDNIIFLFHIFFIFLSEYLNYNLFFKNYKVCITDLANRLTSINILYVKFFQAVALNNNYIDEETNSILLKYTDKTPFLDHDIDWGDLNECMDMFGLYFNEPYPINAGMISVVFKCYKLENDKKQLVVIKMKRKNIEQKLDHAIRKLRFCLNIVTFVSYLFNINTLEIPNLINKNIEIIKQQTNFYQEISNIKLMKEKCKYLNYVKIPDVYDDVTDNFSNIIVMEYIDGMNIKQLPKDLYQSFAKLTIKFGFACILNFGISHGDLHSGNIIFIHNNQSNDDNDQKEKIPEFQLGIIDLGILLILDQDIKNAAIDIFSELKTIPSCDSAKKFINQLFGPPNILKKCSTEHGNYIIQVISKIVDNIKENKKADQKMLYTIMSEINNYFNKNDDLKKLGLYPLDEFIKLQMALAMSHGITLELCKENYIDLTNETLDEMFHRKLFYIDP